jgi:DNA-binding response OmpR family regulator
MKQSCDILVVEDDPVLRESLQEALQREGYAVETAENGLAALRFLRGAETQPRLIILDLMMPAVSGLEFHAVFRKERKLAGTPIIALSAFVDEAQQIWLGLPPEDCIRKPFQLSTLLAAVERHCAGPRRLESPRAERQ